MTSSTEHFGLTKLDPSEGVHAGADRFASSDRDTIDSAIYALGQHHHSGNPTSNAPTDPPTIALSATGGTIPAGTTVRYKYTYTDPETGETLASPEAYITTPQPLTPPVAPTAATQTIGGTLNPGQFFYVLSHYKGANTVETKAENMVAVLVPGSTSTNQVELTLPTLAAGATGFNVYRQAPGEPRFWHVGSTTGTSFTDAGLASSTRTLPSANTTSSTSSVQVSIPGATPAIPAGNLWTIYRTYSGSYDSSYLTQLDENTLTYTDTGIGTANGGPPTQELGALGNPPKISLADGAEIDGQLPVGLIYGFPRTREFVYSGTVVAGAGVAKWLIHDPEIEILSVKTALAVGSSPASTSVIVDVNKYDAQLATPASATIYTTQANRPTITVGSSGSPATVPDVVAAYVGDYITVDVDQAGGGATPTDSDLVVSIHYVAKYTSTTTTTVS